MKLLAWFSKLFDRWGPARKVMSVEGDSLPSDLPFRDLVLCRDDGEEWSIGMRCPCGCGESIELPLMLEAKPRWDVKIDHRGRPTLYPSVWRKSGCRAHFWIRNGRVVWCPAARSPQV